MSSRLNKHDTGRVGDWARHTSSSGRAYFYNVNTQASLWEKPQEWRNHERQHGRVSVGRELRDQPLEPVAGIRQWRPSAAENRVIASWLSSHPQRALIRAWGPFQGRHGWVWKMQTRQGRPLLSLDQLMELDGSLAGLVQEARYDSMLRAWISKVFGYPQPANPSPPQQLETAPRWQPTSPQHVPIPALQPGARVPRLSRWQTQRLQATVPVWRPVPQQMPPFIISQLSPVPIWLPQQNLATVPAGQPPPNLDTVPAWRPPPHYPPVPGRSVPGQANQQHFGYGVPKAHPTLKLSSTGYGFNFTAFPLPGCSNSETLSAKRSNNDDLPYDPEDPTAPLIDEWIPTARKPDPKLLEFTGNPIKAFPAPPISIEARQIARPRRRGQGSSTSSPLPGSSTAKPRSSAPDPPSAMPRSSAPDPPSTMQRSGAPGPSSAMPHSGAPGPSSAMPGRICPGPSPPTKAPERNQEPAKQTPGTSIKLNSGASGESSARGRHGPRSGHVGQNSRSGGRSNGGSRRTRPSDKASAVKAVVEDTEIPASTSAPYRDLPGAQEETEADRILDELHTTNAIALVQVSADLQVARSQYRAAEIQTTLKEVRLQFIRDRIRALEESTDPELYTLLGVSLENPDPDV